MKRLLKQIRAFFPSRLPVGMTEFNTWAMSFFDTYKMPTNDVASIKFTLSTVIMHLGPTAAFKSKFYFYLVLHASAAKQIAGAAFYDTKKAHQAEQEAKTVEATVVTNENQQS